MSCVRVSLADEERYPRGRGQGLVTSRWSQTDGTDDGVVVEDRSDAFRCDVRDDRR